MNSWDEVADESAASMAYADDAGSSGSYDATPSKATPKLDPNQETYGPIQRAYEFFNQQLFEGKLPGALLTLRSERKTMGYFSSSRFGTKTRQTADEIAMSPAYFGIKPIEDTLSTLVHEQAHQYQFYFGKPGRGRYHNEEFAQIMSDRGLEVSSTGRPGGARTGDQMCHYIVEGGRFDLACRQLLNEAFKLDWFDRYPSRDALASAGNLCKYKAGAVEGDAPVKNAPAASAQKDGKEGEVVGDFAVTGDGETGLAVVHVPGVFLGEPRKKSISKLKYTCPKCKLNIWGKPDIKVKCVTCDALMLAQSTEDKIEPEAGDEAAPEGAAEEPTIATDPSSAVLPEVAILQLNELDEDKAKTQADWTTP